MRNTILGRSHLKLGDTYYPLESTVHISHIAQHAVAGERHAFSLEEDRSQKTEDRILARRNSGNSGNPRHFERSGAESRNPFMQKHREERKNLTQITRIFTDFSVRRQITLASERIARSRTAIFGFLACGSE